MKITFQYVIYVAFKYGIYMEILNLSLIWNLLLIWNSPLIKGFIFK